MRLALPDSVRGSIAAVVVLLGAFGCGGDAGSDSSSSVVEGRLSSGRDAAWLTSTLDVIEDRAYYRDRVDWPARRLQAEQLASASPGVAQLGSFVSVVLSDLGDNHSRLVHPLTVLASLQPEAEAKNAQPGGQVMADGVGYVRLPAFSGASIERDGQLEFAVTAGYTRYVDAARDLLLDASACGWVVDLRGNTGGNAYPMLAAAFPLLGPGVAVGFQDRNGELSGIKLSGDGFPSAAEGVVRVGPSDGSVQPAKPVAVITDGATASAGEMVAVAFMHRHNTRSFGTPTQGVPTGNEAIALSDGSMIYLTVGVSVDRSGRTHDTSITPDEVTTAGQDTLQAATAWLLSTAVCDVPR